MFALLLFAIRHRSYPSQRHTTQPHAPPSLHHEHTLSYLCASVLTIFAGIVRFWGISHPDQVVFDEVHFGAFAGQYIRGEYYFDVHPPFAKLLNGLAAWMVGFEGDFGFEQIGDKYTVHNVGS